MTGPFYGNLITLSNNHFFLTKFSTKFSITYVKVCMSSHFTWHLSLVGTKTLIQWFRNTWHTQFLISSVWYNNHHKIFFENNFSTHKVLTHTIQAWLFWAWHRRRGREVDWFNISKLTNAKVMKIGIKTNDNTLSITQPYFADVTIFCQKTFDFAK